MPCAEGSETCGKNGMLMKKRVLIVDDSTLVHEIFGSILTEAGFEVLHAEDGLKAINTAFSEMPDLILLDVWMPKINGYQVCRLLKDHSATKDIPVVIITSQEKKGFVADPRKWSFQTGANGYLSKEESERLIPTVQIFLAGDRVREKPHGYYEPMTENEILSALSRLLDKQLYVDVTRLKELDERKNAFVANVSHEFKSPLAIIQGFLENLNDGFYGPVSDPQKEVIQIGLKTAKRLNRLVHDMLDLSQIEAGKMKMANEKVDLADVVKSVAESFSVETGRKKMAVHLEIEPGELALWGDKDRLTQVVINLFSNAVKYTPEEKSITVRISREADRIRMEIEDTGPGIPPENLEKIFDKFERLEAERQEGTGLGLPIARDIVKLHGGRMRVESEVGKGSKFIVLLPVGVAAA